MVEQGDIIKDSKLPFPLVVISKNLYNETGYALVCPFTQDGTSDFAHYIKTDCCDGFIQCDDLRKLNYESRNISTCGRIFTYDLIMVLNLTGAILDFI